ncbi:MAG: hypothetical protein HC819_10210 [Cyclobacteriaceae bacterium]|nr:hypothetical protein [Cyclobacteriaceae bacterium]
MMQTYVFLALMGWRVLSMMLLGMALLRWGVLTARLSIKNYVVMAVLGLSIGFY